MNYSNQGHNPRIKKLSTAMRRGYAIAKRLGIRRGKYEIAQVNSQGNLTKVCALGYALIGKFGVEAVKRGEGYASINTFNGATRPNPNLMKNSPKSLWDIVGVSTAPEDFVTVANDRLTYPIEKIAKILEKSGV